MTFKISTTDIKLDYPINKLLAGDGILITKESDGGYETLTFSVNGNTQTIIQVINQDGYYSQVSATDTTPEFLGTKLVAGDNITITNNSNGGVERLTIAAPQVDISGLDLTVTEHHNEFSQAIESIIQAVDGYGPDLDSINSYLVDQTRWNQSIKQSLDGYYALGTNLNMSINDINNVSNLTFSPSGTMTTSGIEIIEGNTSLSIYGSVNPGGNLYLIPNDNADGQILFGSDLGAAYIETTHTLLIKNVTATQNVSVGGNIVNKDLSETFRIIRTALDGYADADLTIDNNLALLNSEQGDQTRWNQSVLQALDSYGAATTINNNLALLNSQQIDQTQLNQSVLQALDGYAIVNDLGATGDGYLVFFTGVGSNIAGDNDLYWDRQRGRLGIGMGPNPILYTIDMIGTIQVVVESPNGAENPNGTAGLFTGKGTGRGIVATGGDNGGAGVEAQGGATNGSGVSATGAGSGAGVFSNGGSNNGIGLQGEGGGTNGSGVIGNGYGTGYGVTGEGKGTGYGVIAKAATVTPTCSALRVQPQGAAPSSPQEGDIYANSVDHKLYFYNGTSWVDLTI